MAQNLTKHSLALSIPTSFEIVFMHKEILAHKAFHLTPRVPVFLISVYLCKKLEYLTN